MDSAGRKVKERSLKLNFFNLTHTILVYASYGFPNFYIKRYCFFGSYILIFLLLKIPYVIPCKSISVLLEIVNGLSYRESKLFKAAKKLDINETQTNCLRFQATEM